MDDVKLLERLTYLIQFHVYADAKPDDVAGILEGLEESDSHTGHPGWKIVEGSHDWGPDQPILSAPLDEVAKAICEAHGLRLWENLTADGQSSYRSMARAAIAALGSSSS